MIFTNFAIFRLWEGIARNWAVIKSMKECQNAESTFLYNLTSQYRAITFQSGVGIRDARPAKIDRDDPCSKSQKNGKFVKIKKLFFWIVRVRVIKKMFQVQFLIGKWASDLLTLSMTFCDVSVSRNRFWNAKMRRFGAWRNQRLWNCREPVG